ncbi:hypothetical protein VTN00DRAFT_7299 [Thermoascus crustaceus]|uniref:uncharacterized protein n=1 Tax=Thermoascus crustaceus TaxID=5088 RepID=UPI003742926D
MSTPGLINLPSPPSDPVTPSEMGPGTPNSTTTSLSALSTTAIKDGHQGRSGSHNHHARHSSSASVSSTTTLDAERADRISRLAGLERVTARTAGPQNTAQAATAATPANLRDYFESYAHFKERSTVGSASATSSLGECTTWASGSDTFEADKKSEEPDDGVCSFDGLSDGSNSIAGFGEGASSTISGPVPNAAPGRMPSAGGRPGLLGSPTASRSSAAPFTMQHLTESSTNSSTRPSSPSPNTPEPLRGNRNMTATRTLRLPR